MAGRQVMGWSAGASSGHIRRVPLGPGSPVCCLEQEEEGQLAAPAAAAKLGVQFSHFKWGEGGSSAGSVFLLPPSLCLFVPPLHSQGLGRGSRDGTCLEEVHSK